MTMPVVKKQFEYCLFCGGAIGVGFSHVWAGFWFAFWFLLVFAVGLKWVVNMERWGAMLRRWGSYV